MSPAEWQRIEEAFHAIADLATAEQEAYLDTNFADQPEIAAAVRRMLAGDRRDTAITGAVREVGRDAEASTQSLPSGGRIGSYRLERRLGSGGMGEVFLARRDDDAYEKRVAIKVMRTIVRSAELERRFRNERRILAALEHPNIAHLLDGGTTESGEPYVVMEYVEGLPIDRYCESHSCPPTERLELVREVCAAVQYAHRNLVVHRDIKPGNILVTAEGRVKLLDFGIAKLLEDESGSAPETATLQRLMTPEYASPEQLRGRPVTTATDIYSLGVLLYELLTGRRPHSIGDRSLGEFERLVTGEDPPRPSAAAPESRKVLAGDLDNIVLMALRREPERRYASVDHLAEDIRRHLEGLPVSARPSTTGYRLSKFVRRNRAWIAASLLVAATIGGLIGFYTTRLAAERDEARRAQAEAEQVSGFLVQLFKTSDPNETKGEEVTARELLDRGARRVEEELAGRPRVLGTMLDHIGSIYRTLANYPEAERILERALEVRREALGDEHPETLRSRSDLVELRQLQDRQDEVLDEAIDVLEARRRVLGPDHEETLSSMLDLAMIYKELGRFEDAAAVYEDSLERHLRTVGEEDGSTLWNMNNLAIVYKKLDRYDEALELYDRTLALRRKVDGPDAPATIAVILNKANVHRWLGDDATAAELLEGALRDLPRVMGPDHPYTVGARSNLGMVYLNQGRLDEAVALYEDTVRTFTESLGPDHRNTLASKTNLAIAHRERGEMERAEALFVEVLDANRRNHGAQHPQTLDAQGNLASLLADRGRVAEAERMFREAYDRSRTALGDDRWLTQELGYNLARVEAIQGRVDEAVATLRPLAEAGHVPRERLEQDDGWADARTHPAYLSLINSL